MQKMKNIEFLRLVAILGIVLLHFFYTRSGIFSMHLNIPIYNEMSKWAAEGQKGVDFFFILSGLFFYLGFARNPEQKFGDFIKKKFIRMWPVMAFISIVGGILALFGLANYSLSGDIYALLFLNGTPLLERYSGNLGSAWYCSVMMIHFIFFFYLLKNFNPKIVWLVIAVGVYFSYSMLLQCNHFRIYNKQHIFAYIFNVQMLRAWGGIGIGMLIALWYKHYENAIQNYTPSISTKVLITAGEVICLGYMICNLLYYHARNTMLRNDLMFILVFVAIIAAFICNKGYVSQILNRNIFVSLSKYVYSIFLTHILVFIALKRGFWAKHPDILAQYPITNLCAALLISFIVGVLIYHLVEVKSKNYLTKKLFN